MASSDPKATNNEEFQLNKLFDVKDKVALVTGGGEYPIDSLIPSTLIEYRLWNWPHVCAGSRCEWRQGM